MPLYSIFIYTELEYMTFAHYPTQELNSQLPEKHFLTNTLIHNIMSLGSLSSLTLEP